MATAAVTAAASGPLYYSAVSSSVLHSTVVDNSAAFDGLTAVPSPALMKMPARADAVEALARHFRLGRWYDPPILTLDAGVSLTTGPVRLSFATDLVARTDVCHHLTFLSGSCPLRANQVAITPRSARVLHVQVGSHVEVHSRGVTKPRAVTVVGLVRAGSGRAPYWMGDIYFDYAGLPTNPLGINKFLDQPRTSPQLPQLDAFFTVPATVRNLPLSALVQLRLRRDRIGINSVSTLLGAEHEFAYASTTRYQAPISTDLVGALRAVGQQDSLMLVIVVVMTLELVLLTLFVLFVLFSRSLEVRQREIALARLRGFQSRSVVSLGLLEPLVILMVSVPTGLLLAFGAISLFSGLLLSAAPVVVLPTAIYAALLAFAGGLFAMVLVTRRTLRQPVSEELVGAETAPGGGARVGFEAATLAVALGALVEMRVSGVLSGGEPNPLALFAPGLVAISVGIVATRLLPLPGSQFIRSIPGPRLLGLHLALRQVLRRPTNLRQIFVVCLATGLSTFAVIGWTVAASNRVARADFQTGAARVIHVEVPPSVNFVAAVRHADPSAKFAMAVEESITENQNLLAVDASRLGRVGYWPNSDRRAARRQFAKWLLEPVGKAVVLSGSEARITVGLAAATTPEPRLQFNLLDPASNLTLVDFGAIRPGIHSYLAPLPSDCLGGCRVTELIPYWSPNLGGPQQVIYSLTLSRLQDRSRAQGRWSRAFGGFSKVDFWQDAIGGAAAQSTANGHLVTEFTDTADDFVLPGLVPRDLPPTIRGITTVASQGRDPAALPILDFDGTPVTLDARMQVTALPRLGGYGFLLDLPLAARAETGPQFATSDQVWLAPHAPSRIISALRAAGLKITESQSPAPRLYRYNHGGIAYAYLFFLMAGGAATFLAIGLGAATTFMSGPGRRFELALLRSIGVSRRALILSLAGEQSLVIIPGICLGILAGIVGADLALSSTPQFVNNFGAPPPTTYLPVGPVLLLAVVSALLLLGAAAVTAALALRGVRYEVLRGDGLG
ncbi:MAG: FtsX-like permease family protein [Candidatus Dormibacteria bacterium]